MKRFNQSGRADIGIIIASFPGLFESIFESSACCQVLRCPTPRVWS